MSKLRGYQQQLKAGIYDAWQRGAKCVMAVTATGSGKTVTMADMVRELKGVGVIEAHRSQLVSQISSALSAEGIRHNITAAKTTIKGIVDSHMRDFGKSFYDPRANWTVASVDTIIRRNDPRAVLTDYLFQDEGHHTLRENKWGRAAAQHPNAKILLMTASPTRADGQGLGAHHDGIADAMVLGPGSRELQDHGYLVTYKAYAPTAADLDISDVHITATGEFNAQEAARAVKRSRKIVGDVVEHYLTLCRGKLGITFAADIEHAQTLTDAFNAAGVPAALVTADTADSVRIEIMRRFKARELLQLVNVDLFGEGVDVPAVECVSMARLTASFSLYSQQIGRMLRLNISPVLMAAWDTYSVAQRLQFIAESGKPHGVLLDHVGNVHREFNVGGIKYSGLPEGFTQWTLDRRERVRRPSDDGIPVRQCLGCFKPYERIYDMCPYCGKEAPPPRERSGPEFVDGDLTELTGEWLAKARGEVQRIDGPAHVPMGVNDIVARSIRINHHERSREQHVLREAINLWAGKYKDDPDNVNYKRFYFEFGTDVINACTLGATDAAKLTERVRSKTYETTPN